MHDKASYVFREIGICILPDLENPKQNLMKKLKTPLVVSALLLAFIPQSQAALLAYEGFNTSGDYVSGSPIVGVSGGSGWSGAFTQGGTYSFNGAAGGLSYGDLSITVGQATLPSDGNPFEFVQNSRAFTPVSTGDFWISWLYSPGSPDSIYSGLGISKTSGGELFYIGTDGNGQFRVDTTGAGGGNNSYGALASGTQFVTVNVNYAAGTLAVYRNPTPGGALGTALTSLSGIVPGEVKSVVFLGGANGVTSFDELRLGTTYLDVAPVPEPSAILLLAIVGILPLALRSRKTFLA